MLTVNLQERLEAMLDERRVHINVDPLRELHGADYRSKLLHEELGDWLIEACGDDGLGTPEALHDRDGWLVRIAGAVLYLLHPEDELAHVHLRYLDTPRPAPPAGQAYIDEHRVEWMRHGENWRCTGKWADGSKCGDSVSGAVPGLPVAQGTHRRWSRLMALNPGMVVGPPVGPVDDGPVVDCPDRHIAPAGYEVIGGDDITGPVVYRKGDGTYKRKPRPDVKG